MNSKSSIPEFSISVLQGSGLAGLALAPVFLLGVASSGHAGRYYKCVSPEGRIVLSNMMCSGELKKERCYSLEEVPDWKTRNKKELEAKERELLREWEKARYVMKNNGKFVFPEDTVRGRKANQLCEQLVREKQVEE